MIWSKSPHSIRAYPSYFSKHFTQSQPFIRSSIHSSSSSCKGWVRFVCCVVLPPLFFSRDLSPLLYHSMKKHKHRLAMTGTQKSIMSFSSFGLSFVCVFLPFVCAFFFSVFLFLGSFAAPWFLLWLSHLNINIKSQHVLYYIVSR